MLFNEPKLLKLRWTRYKLRNDARFSALQRAEIAEIWIYLKPLRCGVQVSVLFNEPKLLKSVCLCQQRFGDFRFSALQRAEIAEIVEKADRSEFGVVFQCSSTSRNC